MKNLKAELLANPAVRQAYDAQAPEFELARELIAARTKAGLSIKDLEPMIGQPNRVYEVLSHKRPLTLRMIRNLNKGLGISAQVLITDNMRTQRTPST